MKTFSELAEEVSIKWFNKGQPSQEILKRDIEKAITEAVSGRDKLMEGILNYQEDEYDD